MDGDSFRLAWRCFFLPFSSSCASTCSLGLLNAESIITRRERERENNATFVWTRRMERCPFVLDTDKSLGKLFERFQLF